LLITKPLAVATNNNLEILGDNESNDYHDGAGLSLKSL
jgi:hypothetical protein